MSEPDADNLPADLPDDAAADERVPDEYRMSRGERPERIRRRNLITGLVLVLLIATIVGITIYSRATSEEASSYGVDNPVDRPNQSQKTRGNPADEPSP